MRKITHIVIHCSATPAGREVSRREIDTWHKARGFKGIGYHWLIHLNGRTEMGRPESEIGAHVEGWNANSIGICYVGGLDADDIDIAEDTRTEAQKHAMAVLVTQLLVRYPGAGVLGHRDFPKVAKACPCFDVKTWWAGVAGITGDTLVPNAPKRHLVKAGDTLWAIARQYKVTVPSLRAGNGIKGDLIAPGMWIVVG